MQGNGGEVSQRERDNASAMAEEDAWETVNLPRGLVFFRRICICYEQLYLLRGFVCLFSSRLQSLTPKDYVDKGKTKETGCRPCVQART
jgi:hypothetical protein